MRIDFVSDVACPWCAIGLSALERALERLPDIFVEFHAQPFELNPAMPREGADTAEYLTRKYGMKPDQLAQSFATLEERGAEVGFTFGARDRGRVWNTFDAHRLIYWAGTENKQRDLLHTLFRAYHGEGKNVSDLEVLVEAAESAGLDGAKARDVATQGTYTTEVRSAVQTWREAGITAVPSVIVDDRHLIQGGQPASVFEHALRTLNGNGARE